MKTVKIDHKEVNQRDAEKAYKAGKIIEIVIRFKNADREIKRSYCKSWERELDNNLSFRQILSKLKSDCINNADKFAFIYKIIEVQIK